MLLQLLIQLLLTIFLLPANILKRIVDKMAPAKELDDVRLVDDKTTLDDALGGARNFIYNLLHGKDQQSTQTNGIKEGGGNATPEKSLGIRATIKDLLASGAILGPRDYLTLLKVGEAAALKTDVDDKQYVMERLIKVAVDQGQHSLGTKITEKFVTELWEDLEHPPENNLAGNFRFRKADGSYNSLLHPNMGAAGQPYARTVRPSSSQPAVLPDPELLFDTLLARETPKQHPTKISSMLFYLATIIIHDIFKTSHEDFAYSETSSYLDLAPLYGSNDKQLASMRSGNHDGKLKPDCFSETRLLMLPPGSGILLIMFNRFHNHVAEQLVDINERARFTKPDPGKIKPENYEAALKKFDEEVFQTARLVTCGLYVNIILIDYVRTILNLNRTDSDWQLNPRIEIPNGPKLGIGNQVSAEFNLVYRWHSTVSTRDEQWTKDAFADLFPNRKIEEIDQTEFLRTLGHKQADLDKTPPEQRKFERLERQSNGYYNDDKLAEKLIGDIDDCANTYGPRQVPIALKAVEVLGIKQARAWNLATLNEFRKHFALKPHETFSDITENPETAEYLEHLYKHPDNVELYPGIVVEDAKKPIVPGSGLCPSYTVSRAVLADAVALVRGDRFYTTSYHAKILTNWGFEEADYEKSVDKGCVLYKLFQRALPHHFHPDSIYSHFPFTISQEVKKIYQNELLERAPLYDTSIAESTPRDKAFTISSKAAAEAILSDPSSYNLDLSLAIKLLIPDQRDNKTVLDLISSHLSAGPSSQMLTIPAHLLTKVCEMFESDLYRQIKASSYALPGFKEVDIIQSVIHRCSIRLAANVFQLGEDLNEAELSALFLALAGSWTAFDRPTNTAARQQCAPIAKKLRSALQSNLKSDISSLNKGSSHRGDILGNYRDQILASLLPSLPSTADPGVKADAAFATLVILAADLATTISRRFSESLDAALKLPDSATHLDKIRTSASDETATADRRFNAYAHELGRLGSTAVAVRTLTKPVTLAIDGKDKTLKPGTSVLLSSALINKDSTAFPSPDHLNIDRPSTSYLPVDLVFGPKDNVWQEIQQGCLRSLFKVVGGLKGLKPAWIWDGTKTKSSLRKIPVRHAPQDKGLGSGQEGDDRVAQYNFLTEKWDRFAPVPMSLKVNFDLDH
ncbi:Peroxinectin A [Sphaceloma murrayae]|uniref:Peroxinectin A n=1 Tax=Sphaceloma murrayae TaxID=2082308 RepID=A0A2K1QNR8_9PEZI|nr:Peroxinectin A [Sphaceloma murrayae]